MKIKIPSAPGEAVPEPQSAIEEPDLNASLECIRRLVEQGEVEEARERVNELEERWPDAKRVRYWASVLAPPVVRVLHGERGRPLDKERAWLREHAREYPGCWLAIRDDRLIAADPSLRTVLTSVRQTRGAENALLYFQGPNLE